MGLIRFILDCIKHRRLPLILKTDARGNINGKCPRCGAMTGFTPKKKGERAFACAACGEAATWS